MKNLKIIVDSKVEELIDSYPSEVTNKLLELRNLIYETASEIEDLKEIEETLKWGEPSYLVKKGSTIRMDWKKTKPNQYAIYFKCTSKLVPTFREFYSDFFTFENNRAILFNMTDVLPKQELKQCIKLALTYHKVKHLPFLGMEVQ